MRVDRQGEFGQFLEKVSRKDSSFGRMRVRMCVRFGLRLAQARPVTTHKNEYQPYSLQPCSLWHLKPLWRNALLWGQAQVARQYQLFTKISSNRSTFAAHIVTYCKMSSARASWKLILASASPRRQEILSSLGLRFRVDPARFDEPAPEKGELPSRYVGRMARAKATDVASRHRSGLVISGDTVVLWQDQILGKPANDEQAHTMLRSLADGWHEVLTGICVFDVARDNAQCAKASSMVHFRRMTAREIDWYVATKEGHDKAGSYAIQGYGSLFVDKIEGCYFNVMGFPVSTFERLTRRMKIDLWGFG